MNKLLAKRNDTTNTRKMRIRIHGTVLGLCCLHLVISMPLFAQKTEGTKERVSVAAGTSGIGVVYSHFLSNEIAISGMASYMSWNSAVHSHISGESIQIDPYLQFIQFGSQLDFYPIKLAKGYDRNILPLRLSVGIYYRTNSTYSGKAYLVNGLTIGEFPMNPTESGIVNMKIITNHLMPYLGLGYDMNFGHAKWGMGFDVGGFYHGKPKVEMLSTGLLSDVSQNAQQIENNLNDLRWYPQIQIKFFRNIL